MAPYPFDMLLPAEGWQLGDLSGGDVLVGLAISGRGRGNEHLSKVLQCPAMQDLRLSIRR